jgi:hypothetical protein
VFPGTDGRWWLRALSCPTTHREEQAMPTLHIEHEVTDLPTWISAFTRFADARRQAGVRAERIQRPVDDLNHMVIDLEFDTTGEAEKFLGFLKGQIWGIRENSPALAGTPETMIMETVTI